MFLIIARETRLYLPFDAIYNKSYVTVREGLPLEGTAVENVNNN
jgi:hypothetical protein